MLDHSVEKLKNEPSLVNFLKCDINDINVFNIAFNLVKLKEIGVA